MLTVKPLCAFVCRKSLNKLFDAVSERIQVKWWMIWFKLIPKMIPQIINAAFLWFFVIARNDA